MMLIFIFPMIPLLSAITVAAQAVAPSVVMGVTPIQLQSVSWRASLLLWGVIVASPRPALAGARYPLTVQSITTTPSIGPSSSAAHDVLAVTVTRFRGGNR